MAMDPTPATKTQSDPLRSDPDARGMMAGVRVFSGLLLLYALLAFVVGFAAIGLTAWALATGAAVPAEWLTAAKQSAGGGVFHETADTAVASIPAVLQWAPALWGAGCLFSGLLAYALRLVLRHGARLFAQGMAALKER